MKIKFNLQTEITSLQRKKYQNATIYIRTRLILSKIFASSVYMKRRKKKCGEGLHGGNGEGSHPHLDSNGERAYRVVKNAVLQLLRLNAYPCHIESKWPFVLLAKNEKLKLTRHFNIISGHLDQTEGRVRIRVMVMLLLTVNENAQME